MPSAKGLLYRAVDGLTGGYLPSLSAMLPGEGTYEEREKIGRQILDKNAERQGALGSLLYGAGTVGSLAIPGGAAVRGVRAVKAAKAATPIVASRIGMAKNTARALALGETKMGMAKRAAALGLGGFVASNDATNRPPAEASIEAAPATAARFVPSAMAKAARMGFEAVQEAIPEDYVSQQLTGNGMSTNSNIAKNLQLYAATNSNKQRLDAPERAASTLLEEMNNEMAAAEGDPNITASQLEIMRAKRMKILLGLSGIDASTLPMDEGLE